MTSPMRFSVYLRLQAALGQALTLRSYAGCDPDYDFIPTFIADRLAHHAQALRAGSSRLAQLVN